MAALTLGPLPVAALDLAVGLLQRVTPGQAEPSRATVERLGNVLLFLPLGLLTTLTRPQVRPSVVVLSLLLLSLGIEVVQQAALPDRHPKVLDVVLNAAGATLGVVAGRLLRRVRRGG